MSKTKHPLLTHPFRLVVDWPSVMRFPLLADGNLWKANILHDGPHDGQTARFRRKGVDLIGPLAHIAKEAFNGVRGANVAVHHLRKIIKRQQMRFIFHQAADRFGIALLVFGFEGRQIEQGVLCASLASRCRSVQHSPPVALVWEWHSSRSSACGPDNADVVWWERERRWPSECHRGHRGHR